MKKQICEEEEQVDPRRAKRSFTVHITEGVTV